jgi:lipopolysaccharide biosynthesis glycosyltransferase
MPAVVTITSLLFSAKNKCRYDIYCIVEATLDKSDKEYLNTVVQTLSPSSTIAFLSASNTYNNSVTTQHISTAVYYRLLLPDLLYQMDKVLYLDTDVIIRDSLEELYNREFGDSWLIGAHDVSVNYVRWHFFYSLSKNPLNLKREKYINSGVLLMNLKRLRDANLKETWIKLSKIQGLPTYDQDILNHTCMDKISFFPIKYNYCAVKKQNYERMRDENIITEEEYSDVQNNNIIIYHYLGKHKPWLAEYPASDIWWEYAKMTRYYDAFLKEYNKLSINKIT